MAREGKLITFVAAKGGVGCTFVSTNIAANLSKEFKKPTVLLEFVQQRATANFYLGIQDKSITELSPILNKLEPDMLRGFLSRHSSGLELLSVPFAETLIETKAEVIEKLLSICRSAYDYTIVDIGTNLLPTLTSVFDFSNLFLLISTKEPVSLKGEDVFLNYLKKHHFSPEMLKNILNKTDGTIQTSLKHEIISEIPYADNPEKLSKQFTSLAYKLVHDDKLFYLASGKKPVIEEKKEEEFNENEVKLKVHHRFIKELKESNPNIETGGFAITPKLKEDALKTIEKIFSEEAKGITNREIRSRLIQEIFDEALGLGPLEDFLKDSSVTEIMVNSKDEIYYERKGKLFRSDKKFMNDKQLFTVIERIVMPLGRRIDESSPYVDARLADGSRVNAVIPPLSLKGPTLTIRKFFKERLTIENLIEFGSLTKGAADFIKAAVVNRVNVVISGGTGSGKTTLLNVFSSFIPHDERILTIEDSAELQLPQDHVVRLESRPSNIEGKGAVTIRDLVRNALRMRPDRIVVGECRGGETLDMLQAMNTGHDGSITTLHSNSPRDTLSRLETMVLMSGMELPLRAIREQIASAVELIVHQSRFKDGTRKITHVTEVVGMEGDVITMQDIFLFKQTGIDSNGKVLGSLHPTGIVPTFVEDLSKHGITLEKNTFAP